MLCQFLLYNKVNQLYVYTYTHTPSLLSLPPTLPIPPLQVITKHRADLPVLCGCFPLAIYLTFGSVYMSMPLSHFVTAYPSPSPCPQVHSLVGLCLSSLCNMLIAYTQEVKQQLKIVISYLLKSSTFEMKLSVLIYEMVIIIIITIIIVSSSKVLVEIK